MYRACYIQKSLDHGRKEEKVYRQSSPVLPVCTGVQWACVCVDFFFFMCVELRVLVRWIKVFFSFFLCVAGPLDCSMTYGGWLM